MPYHIVVCLIKRHHCIILKRSIGDQRSRQIVRTHYHHHIVEGTPSTSGICWVTLNNKRHQRSLIWFEIVKLICVCRRLSVCATLNVKCAKAIRTIRNKGDYRTSAICWISNCVSTSCGRIFYGDATC